jgi:hypothetical protein
MKCDNRNNVHDPIQIADDPGGLRYICKTCKEVMILRRGYDRFNNKEYTKVFKRDLLQPHDNLYFKVYPNRMSLA